ncbi:MAG: ThuA domain-containing protein [Verrucomicrobiales bacterium]|nr:ThuA domain-containing protein [Verrucomicrobiales bacterium]
MHVSKFSAFLAVVAAVFLIFITGCGEKKKLSVLILDGQNNHAWQETTPVLTQILEEAGVFEVTVSTSPQAAPKAPRPPKEKTDEAKAAYAASMKKWEADVSEFKAESASLWEAWRPDFAAYDVVVSNYNGELWPEAVQKSFESYVGGGGGFVAVHAANNSFPEWPAYNEMIGVGGWGGRSELSGPYLRLRGGSWVNDPVAGKGGSHGSRHEFVVETQDADHPVVKGLPLKWLHAEDELYDRLRGPAKNVSVLAAAKASEETGGSGEFEPLLMAIDYGAGRVFHTTLGHNTVAMSCLGFQETLKRGTEWAATGKVTLPVDEAKALNENELTIVDATPAEASPASE